MKLKTQGKTYRNLYIFTLCIAMFNKLGSMNTPWWLKYIHCIIWIVLYLYSSGWKVPVHGKAYLNQCRMDVGKIFAGQYVIFWLFTPVGYLIHYSDTSLHVLTRAISSTFQMMLIICSFIATAHFFKEKLLKYTLISMVINYTMIIILALTLCGVNDFTTYGLFPFTEAADAWSVVLKSSKVLEVHDVTFAAGFFFLYAIVWRRKIKHGNLMLISSMVLMYFGWKRTEILVCILLMLLAMFINTKSESSITFWRFAYTITIIGASYIWLWIISSGFYHILAEQYGINFNSREKVYDFMGRLFTLSPLYLGRGMSAAIITNQDAIARGVGMIYGHSDTMLAYIDYGFWGTLIWMLYCTWIVIKKLDRKYGKDASKIWMLFTAYAFVTYLTDNTITYFAFQTAWMVIIFHILYVNQRTAAYEKGKLNTFRTEMAKL